MVKNSPSSVFKLVRTGTQESLREIAANSFQQTICEDPIEILSPIEIALNQSSLQVDYKNSSRDDHFSNVHVTNHMKFTGNYYNYVKKNACFSSSPTGEKFPSPHQKKTLQKSQKSEWYANSVCGFAALGGFLFGYDVGVMSGVILMPSFQDTFGGFQVSNDSSSANKVAWLISCLLLSASLSALIAGSIADKFGRHWCLVFSTVLFFMSCAAQASAQSYAVILISRTLSGFSVGLLSVVVPLYNAEISPASIRGRLVTFEQLAYSSGVLVSYVMNFFVSHLSEGWFDSLFDVFLLFVGAHFYSLCAFRRYSLSVQCGIAFIFAIGMFFLPESPRWLLQMNRSAEATYVLKRIYSKHDVDQKIQEIVDFIHADSTQSPESSWKNILHISVRFRLFIGLLLQALQPLMGYSAVLTYAPTIFLLLKLNQETTTIMIGAMNVLGTLAGLHYIDQAGRRAFLLIGAFLMMLFSLLIGFFNAYKSLCVPPSSYSILVFVSGYVFVYGLSWGPGGWLIPSEIYPLKVRGKAMSITSSANWFFSWLVTYTVPIILESLQISFVFFYFATFCFLGFLHVLLHLPETKHVSLENMDQLFCVKKISDYFSFVRNNISYTFS